MMCVQLLDNRKIFIRLVTILTRWLKYSPTAKMDKIFKNNSYKILELFMEQPTKDFSIRGIARDLGLSHATVINHISNLVKKDLIRKKEETLYPTYYANTVNEKLKYYKKNKIIFSIRESGIVDHLKNIYPSSIVLFGSCAKGEYTEESDIDIFIEAKNTKIDITKFEKKLKRKINILFEQKIRNLSKELRNNILNGVVLYGFLKI